MSIASQYDIHAYSSMLADGARVGPRPKSLRNLVGKISWCSNWDPDVAILRCSLACSERREQRQSRDILPLKLPTNRPRNH